MTNTMTKTKMAAKNNIAPQPQAHTRARGSEPERAPETRAWSIACLDASCVQCPRWLAAIGWRLQPPSISSRYGRAQASDTPQSIEASDARCSRQRADGAGLDKRLGAARSAASIP